MFRAVFGFSKKIFNGIFINPSRFLGFMAVISKVSDIIRQLYLSGNRTSILLLGASGIGKTVGVAETARKIAEATNRRFIFYSDDVADEILSDPEKYFVLVDFSLVLVEPSDLIGIPRTIDSGGNKSANVTYVPFRWLTVLEKCAGILFLDEVTNVSRPDVQSTMLKILLEHEVGFRFLNKDVIVVSAGNNISDSSLAVALPEPLLSGRVIKFSVDAPNTDEFLEYIKTKNGSFSGKGIAFLKKNQCLQRTEKKEENDNSVIVTPRSWEKLLEVLYPFEDVKDEVFIRELVTGLLGNTTIASEFLTWWFTEVPDIKLLVDEPKLWSDLTMTQKYIASTQILALKNVPKQLMEYIYEHDREILILLLSLANAEQEAKLYRYFYSSIPKIAQYLNEVAKASQEIRSK